MAKRRAEIEVTLRDRATAGLKRLSGGFGGLTKAIGLVSATASALTGFLGARFLVGAIRSAGDFTEAMSAVAAVTGASTDELNALQEAANQAGASTRFTATEAANGLEELARSGQTANEAINTLNPVLALAAGNQQTVAESAIQVTTALNAFGLSAEDAARVSDVYTRAAQRSAQTTGQLAQAMSTVAPVARQAGLDVEETSALIGRLADQGFRGERAGTALRNALSQLQDPSSKFARALDDAGITTRDFIEVIGELENGGEAAKVAIRALGLEAAPAIQSLVAGGGPALQGLVDELRNAEGASNAAATALENNLPGALRGLGSAVDAARRKLVEPLVDKLTEDVQAFSDQVRTFVESDALKNLQRFLTEAFDAGREAVREFVGQIDFADVERRIKDFVDGAGDRFQSFRESLGGVSTAWDQTIGIVKMGVGALQTAYNGLGIVISSTADLIIGALKRQAQAFNIGTAGVVPFFRRTAEQLELIQQDVRQTTRDFIDSAAQSNERIAAGFRQFEAAGRDAGQGVKSGMDEAKTGLDEVAQSAETAEDRLAQLKSEMLQAGASAESLGLSAGGSAAGFNAAADAVDRYNRQLLGLGDQVDNEVKPSLDAAGDAAGDAGKQFSDAGDDGEDSFRRTAEAAEDAQQGVKGVGDQTEDAKKKFVSAGGAIASILGSWRTLSEGAAKAVEAFVNSATVNSVEGYFRRLSRFTDGLRETQQRQIEEADRIRESYERTGDAVGFLTQAQSILNRELQLLDPSKVEELEAAVAAARGQMDEARESSAALVRELEDDLLRLQGKTEEIEERRRQRRRDEIELQLRSNDIDQETRQNLEQALRLMNEQAEVRRQQAMDSAASASSNEDAAAAAEREADAAERAADATERSSRARSGGIGQASEINVNLRPLAAEPGAPNLRQADLANLANQLLPPLLQAIRNDLGRGL